MYEEYFGLSDRPFDLTPNPRFLVLTEAHREALSNLEYGIASKKGITLLVGEAGTGKTTIIRSALSRQPARTHAVHLHNPALTRAEFIEMLAARFRLSERARTSKTAMLLELEDLLAQRRAADERTVLIVDEAQSLPLELLEEVRLLANIETDEEKGLSVIIAGQPELADRLNAPELRQLKQRVALRCQLRPLTLPECAGYLAGRIQIAGGVGAHVFTRESATLIHERSLGIPRTICVIADNAMLSAFAAGERPVSCSTVAEVCRDFDIGSSRSEPLANRRPLSSEAGGRPSRLAPVRIETKVAAAAAPPAPPATETAVEHEASPSRLLVLETTTAHESLPEETPAYVAREMFASPPRRSWLFWRMNEGRR
jgi:general secretion pathway protein A